MLRNIRVDEDTSMFQLFFLKDDKNQSVEVEEVSEIDFEKVRKHLEQGESVFIAPKRQERLRTNSIAEDDATEPWYFTHI